MIDTQAIFIEGVTATERTRLAQELKIALDQAGQRHHWLHPMQAGHPLRRPYVADAYASPQDFITTLEAQWQNFALRAAAEGGIWILDACILEPAPGELLTLGAHEQAAELTDRLLDAAAPLRPCMLYLWRDATDDADQAWLQLRDFGDAWFARRHEPRLLLNASRSTPRQLREDALEFLDLDDPGQTAASRALIGTWQDRLGALPPMQVEVDDDTLVARMIPGAPDAAARPLLPGPDNRYLVAGEALALQVRAHGDTMRLLIETLDARSDMPPVVLERAGMPAPG